jgi:integrase
MSALVIVAVCTALRRSELLGLRWQDVDTVRGVLNVSRAVKTTSKGVKTGDIKYYS